MADVMGEDGARCEALRRIPMRHRVRTRSCVEHLHDLRRRRSAHGARLIPRDVVAAAHGAPRAMGHAQARNKQSGAGASRARGMRSWRRSHRRCRWRRHRRKNGRLHCNVHDSIGLWRIHSLPNRSRPRRWARRHRPRRRSQGRPSSPRCHPPAPRRMLPTHSV